jgi:hypothetical protein
MVSIAYDRPIQWSIPMSLSSHLNTGKQRHLGTSQAGFEATIAVSEQFKIVTTFNLVSACKVKCQFFMKMGFY